MILVGRLTYWEIKQKALNGGRSRLADEQLGFVGVERDRQVNVDMARAWAPAGSATPRLLEQQEELARLLDTMPGWVRLAREIVNPK